ARHRGKVDSDRLTQVWLPGMLADVDGGYLDDGLARSLSSPTGRLYDSRTGVGALFPYQPRNVQLSMDKNDDTIPRDQGVTPLVHHGVVTLMRYGNDGYAPKLLPDETRVAFNRAAIPRRRQSRILPRRRCSAISSPWSMPRTLSRT